MLQWSQGLSVVAYFSFRFVAAVFAGKYPVTNLLTVPSTQYDYKGPALCFPWWIVQAERIILSLGSYVDMFEHSLHFMRIILEEPSLESAAVIWFPSRVCLTDESLAFRKNVWTCIYISSSSYFSRVFDFMYFHIYLYTNFISN